MKGSQFDLVNKMGDWSLHRRPPSAMSWLNVRARPWKIRSANFNTRYVVWFLV
jgi:hypothetical protein